MNKSETEPLTVGDIPRIHQSDKDISESRAKLWAETRKLVKSRNYSIELIDPSLYDHLVTLRLVKSEEKQKYTEHALARRLNTGCADFNNEGETEKINLLAKQMIVYNEMKNKNT